jgi:hypothetical protein
MDMKTFMRNQIQEALQHKWNKGIRIGRDPGPEAVSEWIQQHAEKYRKEYEECVEAFVEAVAGESEKRIHSDVCQLCDKKKVKQMSRIVVEEFTRIWFTEMAKPGHNKHIDEM